jgi:hypothetical protein
MRIRLIDRRGVIRSARVRVAIHAGFG